MKTNLLQIVVLLLLIATTCKAQDRRNVIESYYSHSAFAHLNGNLLLAENGQVLYEKSSGFADFTDQTPNTIQSRYNLASISKVITSTVILQLMEKGKLKLDDLFVKYFPTFPYPTITIRHLLTHTSGLPDLELYEDLVKAYPDTVVTNSIIIPQLIAQKKPLYFQPGDKWSYCNTNYELLGLLIEKITKTPLPTYLGKAIFEPAGMKDTYLNVYGKAVEMSKRPVKLHTQPYWYSTKNYSLDSVSRHRYTHYNCSGSQGSSNVITTITDLYLFDKAFFEGKFLKKATMELAFTPVKLNDGAVFYEGRMDTMMGEGKGSYGLGWELFEQPLYGKSVGHGGFKFGLATFYYHNLSKNQTIIAFDNTADRDFGKVVTSALALMNNQKPIETTTKKSLAKEYGVALKEKGAEYAITKFHELKSDTAHYYLSEKELNWLGYDFLYRADFKGHKQLSLETFKLNTLLFPTSFNVYDSFGDSLLESGKKEEAIAMYEKALALNPKNEESRQKISRLK
ncbi:serine hydrolase [Runella sp.]|uniref:serine hydrolase n=1 Tax=Runella sp. TaxID=1960881 RepID=UPI003D1330AC